MQCITYNIISLYIILLTNLNVYVCVCPDDWVQVIHDKKKKMLKRKTSVICSTYT